MDKTKEEFEKTISGFYVKKCVENGTMEQAFYDNQFGVFKDGRQSRDEEIHRLEQIATENSDWFDALKIDFDKQKEEIKKLKNALGGIDGNELL